MVTNNKMATSEVTQEKILFLCYHNSARSQMAEGFLRDIYGDIYEAYSAGIEATNIDSRAVFVMQEIGIDISRQRSKASPEYQGTVFDILVTVCDRAKQACPICNMPEVADPDLPSRFPKAERLIHKSFEDPAEAVGSEEEQLIVFRRVRDEIRKWVTLTFGK